VLLYFKKKKNLDHRCQQIWITPANFNKSNLVFILFYFILLYCFGISTGNPNYFA